MPLEPDVKLMLDAMASANMNPFEDDILSKTAEQLRAALAANRMPAPEVPIARFEDTSFTAGDGGTVPVRVYWPATDGGPRPAIVFYHGGGWVIGGLDTHDRRTRKAVVNRERLSREKSAPADGTKKMGQRSTQPFQILNYF